MPVDFGVRREFSRYRRFFTEATCILASRLQNSSSSYQGGVNLRYIKMERTRAFSSLDWHFSPCMNIHLSIFSQFHSQFHYTIQIPYFFKMTNFRLQHRCKNVDRNHIPRLSVTILSVWINFDWLNYINLIIIKYNYSFGCTKQSKYTTKRFCSDCFSVLKTLELAEAIFIFIFF